MSTLIEPVVSAADLDAMPDDGNRYELIDGEILVSRAPAITHQLIVDVQDIVNMQGSRHRERT